MPGGPHQQEMFGEWILKNYAKASQYIGLHFKKYDDFIFEPVIKREILQANPRNKGHITVYLSAYSDQTLIPVLQQLPAFRFEVFSKQVIQPEEHKNVKLIPVNQRLFNESLINSFGVITGAGFETPAEVLHLAKKTNGGAHTGTI